MSPRKKVSAPAPVPEPPVQKPAPSIAEVILWHKTASALAPAAPSFVKYEVLVRELDAAIALLRDARDRLTLRKPVDEFLARHTEAPYAS